MKNGTVGPAQDGEPKMETLIKKFTCKKWEVGN
jgi:hypothetical protein